MSGTEASKAETETANPVVEIEGAGRLKLLKSLKPMVVVSEVMGVSFFGNLHGKRLQFSVAYRLLVLVAMALCLWHEIPTIEFWITSLKGLHGMLAFVETWYRWAILFVNFILNACNNSRIVDTITALSDLPIVADAGVYTVIRRFLVLLLLFNLTLIICYMCLGHDIMWNNSNYKWYTSTVYIVTEFYIAFSNVQFVSVLYAIRQYFRTVNDHLQKSNFGVNTIRDCRTFLFIVDATRKQDGLFDIVKFRELHLNLSCICIKLNECFTVQIFAGLAWSVFSIYMYTTTTPFTIREMGCSLPEKQRQILLFLVLSMLEITYSLRSGMIFIVSSNEKESDPQWTQKPFMEILLTIFWGGYYFVNLLELLSSCDYTAAESRRTSVVVHELINHVQDKNLERQLQLFSLQLMNHAAIFTAGRFFHLDFALLHSIMGAITTYIVIIITFRE